MCACEVDARVREVDACGHEVNVCVCVCVRLMHVW